MLCHVVYGQPPLTRKERAENDAQAEVHFTKYSEAAQAVLDNLLDKYADAGVQERSKYSGAEGKPFDNMGTLPRIIKAGCTTVAGYNQALSELEKTKSTPVQRSA